MSRDYWSGRRVLLTGHTGFKGAWLSLWLQSLGAEVVGYSLDAPSSPSLFELADVKGAVSSHVHGDVRDLAALQAVFDEHQPEVVLHLAAQSLVIESYTNPLDTYTTNVIGTANVLEAARHTPSVRVIVNVTTDKCYENREWHWGYREDEAMGGHDPYSSSKGCSELLTSSYARSFFHDDSPVRLASARAGNVIGGGDWAENRLVPDFMRAIVDGDTLIIRSPNSIRPWQHVLEPLSGYLSLAEHLAADAGDDYVGAWNFGPHDSDAQPVSWIADRLCEKWPGASWRLDDPANVHVHEATYLKLDCSKARAELSWAPRLDLDTALDWIVEWYQTYVQGGDVGAKALEQIARYEAS